MNSEEHACFLSFRLYEAVIDVFCFCLVCFSFPFLVFAGRGIVACLVLLCNDFRLCFVVVVVVVCF